MLDCPFPTCRVDQALPSSTHLFPSCGGTILFVTYAWYPAATSLVRELEFYVAAVIIAPWSQTTLLPWLTLCIFIICLCYYFLLSALQLLCSIFILSHIPFIIITYSFCHPKFLFSCYWVFSFPHCNLIGILIMASLPSLYSMIVIGFHKPDYNNNSL